MHYLILFSSLFLLSGQINNRVHGRVEELLCNPRENLLNISKTLSSIRGNIAPVVTPFKTNGDLKLEIIPEYAKFLAKNCIKNIYVNGPDEDGCVLTFHERKKLVKAWIKESKTYGINVMVEAGCQSFREVMAITKYAKEEGADAIAVLPDVIYRPNMTDQGVEYVRRIAEVAEPLPVYYTDLPEQTLVNLNMMKFVGQTENIKNFAGIITNLETALRAKPINVTNKHISYLIYGMYSIPSAYTYCFDGTINIMNTVIPSKMIEQTTSVKNGDYVRAINSQLKYNDIATQLLLVANYDETEGKNERVIRAYLREGLTQVTGIQVGPPPEPSRKEVTKQEKKRINKILRDGGIIQ